MVKKLAGITISLVAAVAIAQTSGQDLVQGFKNPPESAKPRTWWHWTNGNVTLDGITKDLEWMKRSGIGGFQLVDVASGGGQTVEKKINFGTQDWLNAVHHSAVEGQRLGLEMSIFSSPGWSEAGGPWVKPAEAMKKLVWSETDVEGSARSLPTSCSSLLRTKGRFATGAWAAASKLVSTRTVSCWLIELQRMK